MTRNAKWLAAAFSLTFLIGGGMGYFLGHWDDRAAAGTRSHDGEASPHLRAWNPSEDSSANNDPSTVRVPPTTEHEIANAFQTAVRARDYFRRRQEVYAAGQQLTAETIRTAMDATQQFSEYERENTQYELVARWLELDVAAAYAWVSALPKQRQRSSLMTEFFHSLGMKDPQTALTYLARAKLTAGSAADHTHSVFEAWSVHDPVAAVDAALALTDQRAKDSAVDVTLQRWAQRDPQAALKRIEHLPDADGRRRHLKTILSEWAEEDAEAAARHVASLPEGKDRHEGLASVIAASAGKDPDAALRLLAQLPAGPMRVQAITSLINKIQHEEPALAAKFFFDLPAREQNESAHQLTAGLAQQDPAAALEFAGRLASNERRASALRNVMEVWSSNDPKAAAEFCASNPLGTPEVMASAVGNWARQDAPEALAWARALPDGPPREAALVSAVTAIATTDPSQAARLAATLLTGEKQARAAHGIAAAWAAREPQAAAAWAAELADRSARLNALASVARKWSSEDPVAAAAWASKVPENAAVLSVISSEWAEQDPASAAKWLDTLSSGNARDLAVSNFATVVAPTDPAGAAAWATTISDLPRRDSAVEQIFRNWKRADSQAAEDWLRSTPGLSSAVRERMSQ